MKMIYKSKEITNTTNSYNDLLNKPCINSVELTGNVSTGDLGIYSKADIKNILASSRSVKQVTALPTPTIKNTMYYVGPQADGSYHIYLFDSDNRKIDLGSTTLELYKSGVGIEVDSNNNINFRRGAYLMQDTDSEGKISIMSDEDIDDTSDHNHLATAKAVYDFTFGGATSGSAGGKGIVPDSSAGDQDKYLRADGTWCDLLDAIYPIGSCVLGAPPSFGTWTQISGNNALWINSGLATGSVISQALPKPTLAVAASGAHTHTAQSSGAHTHSYTGWWSAEKYGSSAAPCIAKGGEDTEYARHTGDAGAHTHSINSSGSHNHTINVLDDSVYGSGTKVQPDAYVVNLWCRTA